ncbi:MAG: hypothetical protein R2690_08195 [Acidimicrobiales bacterium]
MAAQRTTPSLGLMTSSVVETVMVVAAWAGRGDQGGERRCGEQVAATVAASPGRVEWVGVASEVMGWWG